MLCSYVVIIIIFRMRKRNMARAVVFATKIQSVARGRLGRNYFRKNYKRLVKERRIRVMKKREKAARVIQGLRHIQVAKQVAQNKRVEKMKREAEQRLLDDLDAKIDIIHEQHMLDLMTTRMQTGARLKIARKCV